MKDVSADFSRSDIAHLARWIITEWQAEQSIFGIPRDLFYIPDKPQLKSRRFGLPLATPLGVAAGPHTQLAQNMIAAFLSGARFIELKTVQILDELTVNKPCIAMDDEGYNCEWSQELLLADSADEYCNAWILIHLVHHLLGWEVYGPAGTIFNLSVGYDLAGVTHPKVQRFIDTFSDIYLIKQEKMEKLRGIYPAIDRVVIPDRVSDNICLSTMHGCPPDEIEKIALHLIRDKRLHTTIKLNPTLLGADRLRHILNERLGYPIVVPDEAFAHDLKFDDAVAMLQRLKGAAREAGVSFSVKLTNTLETENSSGLFSPGEKMVYMSGRPLHVLSVALAARLQAVFHGELDISFAGGAHSGNVAKIIGCGLAPVTVCSDFLKPGGTMRALQYLEALADERDIARYLEGMTPGEKVSRSAAYADEAQQDDAYAFKPERSRSVKTSRELFKWDCAAAPCAVSCPVEQEIPTYMYHVARGENAAAGATILRSNPLAHITGMICTQGCQTRCMRTHIDDPLLIREIKRFAIERGGSVVLDKEPRVVHSALASRTRIAVIGAGPAGLAAAYFLAEKGCQVALYEKQPFAGGLVAEVIPDFRLHREVVERDVKRVVHMGVHFHLGTPVDQALFDKLHKENDFVLVACGLGKAKQLDIPGEGAVGVWDHLTMLGKVKAGQPIKLGSRVVVIGGGDAAVDAARTARRIVGPKGRVSLLYRRDKKAMPAHHEEVGALLREGVNLIEWSMPLKILTFFGMVRGVRCRKTRPAPDKSAARSESVTAISGSDFTVRCNTVVVAIGQRAALDFGAQDLLLGGGSVGIESKLRNVFVAGDLFRGSSSIIRAGADGRLVARAILRRIGFVEEDQLGAGCLAENYPLAPYYRKLATRVSAVRHSFDVTAKSSCAVSFEPAIPILGDDEAKSEASRCLRCDKICNVCVTVCPNRANISYLSPPGKFLVHSVTRNSQGESLIEVMNVYELKQAYQVANIVDFCNECGSCATFCPTSGEPYRQKPRLHLKREGLLASSSGFYLDASGIEAKFDGKIERLSFGDDRLVYETREATVELQRKELSIISCNFKFREIHGVTTNRAVEMAILYEGLKNKGFLSKIGQ